MLPLGQCLRTVSSGLFPLNIAFGFGPLPRLEKYMGLAVVFSIAFGVVSSPPLKRYWSGFFTTAQEILEWFLHHRSRDNRVVYSPPLMMFHLYVYSLGIAFLYWFFGATRNIASTLWNSYYRYLLFALWLALGYSYPLFLYVADDMSLDLYDSSFVR